MRTLMFAFPILTDNFDGPHCLMKESSDVGIFSTTRDHLSVIFGSRYKVHHACGDVLVIPDLILPQNLTVTTLAMFKCHHTSL